MTGFGRASDHGEEIDFSVEIKTVNHRYRDFNMRLPRELNALENKIKKLVSTVITRGRIDLYINFTQISGASRHIHLNKDLTKNYLEVLNQIKQLDSMISDEIRLDTLANLPDVIREDPTVLNDDLIWGKLKPILEKALDQVNESRSKEGDNMKADLLGYTEEVEKGIDAIEGLAPIMRQQAEASLRAKITEYLKSDHFDEQRVLTEVAIIADKCAIDEEIARLKSHTERLKTGLEENRVPIGRKLDFLVQEMNREVNTIGSKSNNIEISNKIVDLKSEIEKIREQIQNIE